MIGSFQKITYRSLDQFPEETDDGRNLTMTYRAISDYFTNLGKCVSKPYTLTDFLSEKTKKGEGKIKVLDCGAGEGHAVDTLLSSEYGSHIKKVTGISLHSFNHVKEVLSKHKAKVDWYLGDAVTILNKLPAEYDLVMDVQGPYLYSQEKIKLIKAMHDVLKIGGRAYIYRYTPYHDNLVDEDGNRERMEEMLARLYPQTFKFFETDIDTSKRSVLLITKSSKRCPPLEYEVVRAFYRSINPKLTRARAVQGNAWYPKKVIFKKAASSRSLRPLESEPEAKRNKSSQEQADPN